jgi:soluble lytic murein transglycosylase-like protein
VPRLSYLEVKQLVEAHNKSTSFSTELVVSICWKEASFDPAAHSSTSTATGLMQMTTGAVADVNANTPRGVHYDHSQMSNGAMCVECATYYLQILKGRHGTIKSALEHYGTGSGYADNLIACETCIQQDQTAYQACLNQIHT